MKPQILITGIKGGIGQILAVGLAKDYIISGFDKDTADITKPHALEPIFAKVKPEYVIHLAADAYPFAHFDLILQHNILGTKNVYDACVKHDVKRVLFASSTHAFYQNPKVTEKSLYRPDEWYGWSKAAGELMAKMYFDKFGLSSAILRIGHVTGMDTPDPNLAKLEITPAQLIGLTKRALSSAEPFAIYRAIG